MKKFMNEPRNLLIESINGFAAAHADIISLDVSKRFVRRKSLVPGKVGLVSGGGAGHEPMHLGFVGRGMLDAACIGRIFTSPTPDQIVAAAQAVDAGKGLLFIVKNYDGDRMNFQMAQEMSGLAIETVFASDEAVQTSPDNKSGRRGLAGTLVLEKILGAAAERKLGLKSLLELADRVGSTTRSMGVALTSCTLPEVGRPTFVIGEAEMELGVGIHGEPGRKRVAMMRADEIAEDAVSAVASDMVSKGNALVLVNGFGGTPLIELYLMYNAFAAALTRHGFNPVRRLVGNFVTSLDMAGCSITVSALDDELLGLWDDPVHTAALRWKI
jgi:phosphoenolpyruvate---glycerone phosphotransferase subunit DhaK